jgi:hypothetical protein
MDASDKLADIVRVRSEWPTGVDQAAIERRVMVKPTSCPQED